MTNHSAPREIPVRNPRTGEMDYAIHPLDGQAVAALSTRLRENQPAWAAAGLEHRVAVLRRWSAGLLAEPGAVLTALSADTGRHLLALGEIRPLGGLVEGYAALGAKLLGEPAERPSMAPGIGMRAQLVPYALVGVHRSAMEALSVQVGSREANHF